MTKELLFHNATLVTRTSATFEIEDSLGFSINARFTGSAVGTLSIQGALMDAPDFFSEVDTVAISGLSRYLLNFIGAQFDYVRLVYTHTSGSGTAEIWGGRKV